MFGSAFGAKPAAATGTTSSFSFGQPAAAQQQQPATTLGTFGSAPAATTTTTTSGGFAGFAGFGQQPQQQQPATTSFSGFGAKPATSTTAPATSAFGTSLFQPTATTNSTATMGTSLFQPAATTTGASTMGGSMFGASLAQQQQQQQQAAQPAILQDIENVMAAYEPSDQRCRFRHPFYNLVPPGEATRYARPAHIPEGLWRDAVSSSPDPDCMVPVFASGFADLQKRVEHQNHQTRANQAKLDELRTELERIDQRLQLETNGRLVKCQREHVKLAQKVLRVMGMVQLLRSHGHTNLTREEEELRARFEKLLKQMHAPEFRGYVDEMATQVNTLKTAQRAVSQPSRRAISFEVVDEQTLADMFKVLHEMQTGLQQLTDVLKNDLGAVNVIAKGYATPTSVATGRR